jgi:choline monooxygenase
MDQTEKARLFAEAHYYQKTRRSVEDAHTLPPDCYRDPTYHEQEREKLFGHAWQCVGYSSQVSEVGQVIKADLAGQPIIITKDQTGTVRGFFNVCRHRASILVEEAGKINRFRCPYHSWTYDLAGNLTACPLFETQASSFNKSDYSLLPVRVAIWGCFIFATLDQNAEPLLDYLGDIVHHYKNFPLHELVLVRRKNYSIKANWKLIAENFLEYYHLPWVHPELCQVAAIDMHKRNQGAGMYMSFYAHPLLKGGTALDADFFPPMPHLDHQEKNAGYFPFVFPNLATFLLPHHLFVLLMNPKSVDESTEYGDLLVHPSLLEEKDAEHKLDEIFCFYDMVNLQDIVAVERVQQGLKTKSYPGGRMCYRFEEPVHRFQNMVIDFMTNERRSYLGD